MAGAGDPAPPPRGARELLNRSFTSTGVTRLRHEITALVTEVGLTGQAREDFILAVNELATNAVRHGGGAGQVLLWLVEAALVCEVVDRGNGLPADHPIGQRRPPAEVAGGWGLWLARRLSDDMSVNTGPDGTTIRIKVRVGAGH